jgi:hypothetical protein
MRAGFSARSQKCSAMTAAALAQSQAVGAASVAADVGVF